jgi:hypothetical protein
MRRHWFMSRRWFQIFSPSFIPNWFPLRYSVKHDMRLGFLHGFLHGLLHGLLHHSRHFLWHERFMNGSQCWKKRRYVLDLFSSIFCRYFVIQKYQKCWSLGRVDEPLLPSAVAMYVGSVSLRTFIKWNLVRVPFGLAALLHLCFCPFLWFVHVYGVSYYSEGSLGVGLIGKARALMWIWCCIATTAIIIGEVGQNTRNTMKPSEPFIFDGRPNNYIHISWTVLNRSFRKDSQKSDSSWTVPNRSEPFRSFISFTCKMNRSEPYIWWMFICFYVQNESFWTVHLMDVHVFFTCAMNRSEPIIVCPNLEWHMNNIITKMHM